MDESQVVIPVSSPRSNLTLFDESATTRKLWHKVEALFTRRFHNPDLEAAKVVLACTAAHRIAEYPPSWNMAVAVAGSMKTVILEALDGLPDVYLIDEVTPQTFISGKIDNEGHERKNPASLLHRIGKQGIVIALIFPRFSRVIHETAPICLVTIMTISTAKHRPRAIRVCRRSLHK
jgi:hypothetical protein